MFQASRTFSFRSFQSWLKTNLSQNPFGVAACIAQGRHLCWPMAGQCQDFLSHLASRNVTCNGKSQVNSRLPVFFYWQWTLVVSTSGRLVAQLIYVEYLDPCVACVKPMLYYLMSWTSSVVPWIVCILWSVGFWWLVKRITIFYHGLTYATINWTILLYDNGNIEVIISDWSTSMARLQLLPCS